MIFSDDLIYRQFKDFDNFNVLQTKLVFVSTFDFVCSPVTVIISGFCKMLMVKINTVINANFIIIPFYGTKNKNAGHLTRQKLLICKNPIIIRHTQLIIWFDKYI